MQVIEVLFEVWKFEVFNKMFVFVVYDLKNIVIQFVLMLKNVECYCDNLEFQQDMLMMVEYLVECM